MGQYPLTWVWVMVWVHFSGPIPIPMTHMGYPYPHWALLPTKLAELHNDQSLLQDIWVTPSIGEIPRWLEDIDVREGIRAVLKSDHCLEEQCRLGIEADNMCWWYGCELCAVELAIQRPESM